MNRCLSLYLKKLKENLVTFLFLLVGTLGLDLYVFLKADFSPGGPTRGNPVLLLAFLPIPVLLFSLPVMLAHSISKEWRSGTHYLMLSLPVRNSSIGLCKYLAILTVGAGTFVASAAPVQLIYNMIFTWTPGLSGAAIPGVDFWVCSGSWFFSILCLLLGMVTGMAGVKYSVKRYRGVVSLGFFVFGFYLFGRLLKPAVDTLSFLGTYHVQLIEPAGRVKDLFMPLSGVGYLVVAGTVFLIVGLVLFDRFVEV